MMLKFSGIGKQRRTKATGVGVGVTIVASLGLALALTFAFGSGVPAVFTAAWAQAERAGTAPEHEAAPAAATDIDTAPALALSAIPLVFEAGSDALDPLPLAAISVVEPSAQGLSSNLPLDDLQLYLSARSPSAALIAGTSLAAQGNLDASVAMLSQAIQSYPSDPNLRLSRMETALVAGDAHVATADAVRLFRDEDANPVNYMVLLAALARNAEWDAIGRLEVRDLDQPVLNFLAQGIWAIATLDLGQPGDGLRRMDQTFSIDGFDGRKQFLIGMAKFYGQEAGGGLEDLVASVNSLGAGAQRAAMWSVRAAAWSKRPQLADSILATMTQNAQRVRQQADLLDFEQALPSGPPSKRELIVEMFMQVAWLFIDRDQLPTAQLLTDYANLIDGGALRTSAPLTVLRIGIATSLEEPQLRLMFATQLADLAPGAMLGASERVAALMGLDDLDAALALLDRVEANALVKHQGVDRHLYALRGGLLARQQRYAEALTQFERWDKAGQEAGGGIADVEFDWLVYFQWANASYWSGNFDQMERLLNRALALSPQNAFASNFLAYYWVDQGIKLEDGLEMLLSALEARPDSASITDSVGWAYFRLGQYDKALEYLESAWNLESTSWEISDHLGDAYDAVGRQTEALWFWQRALILEDIPKDRAEQITQKIERTVSQS